MFHLAHKIPRGKIYVAVSGGVDSMVLLDFVRNGGKRDKDIVVLHFNHGTAHSYQAEDFVVKFCRKNKLSYRIGYISQILKPKNKSQEEWWREQRYEFFHLFSNAPILMAHILNDAVETWVFSSLNGKGYLIPIKRDHFIRPFLLSNKKDIEKWAKRKKVPYTYDQSNDNITYMRNYIRHTMMPHILAVNPGIEKVILKKYLKADYTEGKSYDF